MPRTERMPTVASAANRRARGWFRKISDSLQLRRFARRHLPKIRQLAQGALGSARIVDGKQHQRVPAGVDRRVKDRGRDVDRVAAAHLKGWLVVDHLLA